jgi:L-threonylcarbamoyladenylate synthase
VYHGFVSGTLPGDDPETARRAAACLRAGGLVAFPTETVYGLGADALNPVAVARIFEAKGRPRFDPLIVHLASVRGLDRYAAGIDPRARTLAARLWPGPLTLVVPRREGAGEVIPDIVTAGLPTVALRVPDHPVALAIIEAADRPVAAPSANPFGYVSPTTAAHVAEQLGAAVDLVVDGGPARVGVESTIVAFTGGRPRLLRPGGVPIETIEALIGPVETVASASGDSPEAPGQLASHYAPRSRFVLLAGRDDPARAVRPGERVGLLALTPPAEAGRFTAVEVLSPTGDLREAAHRLFGAMRRLDAAGLERIVAEPVPETGLGRAIMDRLRRAAAGTP